MDSNLFDPNLHGRNHEYESLNLRLFNKTLVIKDKRIYYKLFLENYGKKLLESDIPM